MMQQMQAMRKEVEEKTVEVLTEQQKQQFAAMKGEAFEMPEGGMFGGFGGRGPGGGQGRPGGGEGRPPRPNRPGGGPDA
jgi:hypothetical protein